ncbi:MAG: hypothetical protein WBE26_00785 [Phycisphaerae bacterium]
MSPGKTLDSEGREKIHAKGEDQLFSFKAVYQERQINTAAATGTNTLSGATVPAGEVWIVRCAIACDVTSGTDIVSVYVNDSGVDYLTDRAANATAAQVVGGACWAPMKAGDNLAAKFYGCVSGDDLYLYGHGFKMSKES